MATPAFPPGGTYFDNAKRSFTSVPINVSKDNAISTTEFLEAAEAFPGLFDVLGSAAFTPVKKDMNGNIQSVRARQLEAPLQSETIQELCLNELKAKKHDATESLVWLVRGLDFTSQALRRNLTNSSEELSVSFRDAYSKTLKPHHSFLVKPLFSAAMSACPYRKDFYRKLGDDQPRVEKEMDAWLSALAEQVKILQAFLAKKEAQW